MGQGAGLQVLSLCPWATHVCPLNLPGFLCPALLEDNDAVWVSVLQMDRGSFPFHGEAPGSGQPWPAPWARVLPKLQAASAFGWQESSAQGVRGV